MHDKEKLVKQQRLAEATKKNYTSLDGKFGIILKQLGMPILGESVSGIYSQTELPDVYEIQSNDELPVADIDESIVEIGMVFDGLKYGHNIEIKYLKYGKILDVAEKILDVTYNGRLVYREIENDLDCFVPMREWEDAVEKFYVLAKRKQDRTYKENKKTEIEETKQMKLGFIEHLRNKWGI